MNVRNVVIGVAAAAVVAGVVVSCGGGGGGYGGGSPASPPVASGTGRGALVVDSTSRAITGGFSFVGVSGTPTSAGIFLAAAGANAADPVNPLIPLTIDRVNAIVPANTPALTLNQLNDLQAGNFYFLVKTTTFPDGEIRGQITGTANLAAGLAPSIDAAQEGGGVVSSGTGQGVFVVDSSTRLIYIALATFGNLTTASPSLAHIHRVSDGGVRVNLLPPLAALATTTDPDAPIAPQDLTDFTNGNLYFNVHTATYPGGEIRGAIVPTTTQVVRSAGLDTTQVVP